MALAAGHDDVDMDLVRHVTLDGIRLANSKFRRQYGEMVIAIDGKHSWRKQQFPYYKAMRAQDRAKSKFNWEDLFRCANTVKSELKEIFPYKVIEHPDAEADDTIGVLVRHSVKQEQPVIIVSGDKDFIQLQINTNLVTQWDKVHDRYITSEDPKRYLFEHVLKGDRGDGIPNVLSQSDCFVRKIRQKPLRQTAIDQFWEDSSLLKQEPIYSRFVDNLKLIDLKFTPANIQQEILQIFNDYQINDRNMLYKYFMEKQLKKLMTSLGEF